MTPWPFGRKSRRKRSRSGTLSSGEGAPQDTADAPTTMTAEKETTTRSAARQSVRKPPSESKKLQRRQRTYSFEEGDGEKLEVDRVRSNSRKQTRPNSRHKTAQSTNRSVTALANDSFANQDGLRQVPTLHKQPHGDGVPRKKSSKRRKADNQRAAEIKAMSNFMPVRPATEDWQAGRPINKETLREKPARGLGLRDSWQKEHLASDVSLPLQESLHSSVSGDSADHMAFRITAFEALAPRPTLRYAFSPKHPSTSGIFGPQRTTSQRKKHMDEEIIPAATVKSHKRINELADDLTASDLRELMERDKRRREREQKQAQEKMERRLARRAEKVKAEEAAGRESPANLERGVLGRESTGLGIDPVSAVVTSSRRRLTRSSDNSNPFADTDKMQIDDDNEHGPLREFHRTNSVPLGPPVLAPALDQSHIHPLLRTQKSRSRSPPLVGRSPVEVPESMRRPSGQDNSSPTRGGRRWSAIFKWGNNRPKRYSGEPPSSFSNTSRDSMSMSSTQIAPLPINVPRKMSSSVPRRTGSRFREDLPETPLTPPASRLQSPEHDSMPPVIMEQDSPDVEMSSPIMTNPFADTQEETPSSSLHSSEHLGNRAQQMSQSPHLQSVSMASIDSEGSWLSSRLQDKRRTPTMLVSPPHSQRTQPGHWHNTSTGSAGLRSARPRRASIDDEGASITEDEYLSRYANQRNSGSHWGNRETEAAAELTQASSDEGEGGARWGNVGGRQLAVVQKPSKDLAKSQEGLLNRFVDEATEDDSDLSDADKTEDSKETKIQRATSVDLSSRRHVRHISAGSAKLLDIPKSPTETRRTSLTKSIN